MTTSLQRLSDDAAETAKLRGELNSIERVQEIDPNLIEGSFVGDRLGSPDEDGVEALMESIAESGQQVPVLLRPHPKEAGRYQIAYGHRRVMAVRRLGVPVKAVVRSLSDAELVIAQGKENLDRRDLSFIERAWFARGLEDRQFSRKTIMAALGVSKGDLSVMLSIIRSLPEDLVRSIGPAPKAGKPRWMQLAESWKALGSSDPSAVTAHPRFQAASSDARFTLALQLITSRRQGKQLESWSAADGRTIVTMRQDDRAGRVVIDERAAPEFTKFVMQRMPELFEAYQHQHGRSSQLQTVRPRKSTQREEHRAQKEKAP